jgi:thiol-disulfide isomerase/thioredoxin
MKIIALTFILLTSLFGFQKGDVVPQNLAKHLGITGDKIYVIDFFASWCASCKKELPLMSKANSSIDDSKVEFIGIDVDKDVQKGIAFQNSLKEQNKLNFRVINDPQNMIIKEFKPIGMPTLYYVKDQKILGIISGAVDNIDGIIKADLAKFGAE